MNSPAEMPRLSNADISELTQWRRGLHQFPELSGKESRTAATVAQMLADAGAGQVITGLGGHGVAGVFDSGRPGPRILLRCELDGLPIEDLGQVAHRSQLPGQGHQCGHDGHMAILAAMARLLGRKPLAQGAVILMFQPAEEDGSGARLVVRDPRFAALKPDYAFAIHNMPGLPFGHVAIAPGPVCCASRGMRMRFSGRTAHASMPETGISPMRAVAALMPGLADLASAPGIPSSDPDFALVTVTHAQMGAPAFGVAPGEALVFATLRSLTDARMSALVVAAEGLAQGLAQQHGLGLEIGYEDVFVTCDNDPQAALIVRRALDALAVIHDETGLPMRASEDFGGFGHEAKLALMMLGAGMDQPALHNPDYDFPDDLIAKGAQIFSQIIAQILQDHDQPKGDALSP